ncbi:DUF397 domain-containing protein [Streptomyces sp. NPDC087440]|uniref:DUF397 domain-containing protein n=1 Tax=Streptomyces sp. NPDC087440 TaxID=3365790 RepID=UPI00380EA985
MSELRSLWVKSSYSNTDGGSCVEWMPSAATAGHGPVPVRDSKSPDGPVLAVPAPAWTSFVDALKGSDPLGR